MTKKYVKIIIIVFIFSLGLLLLNNLFGYKSRFSPSLVKDISKYHYKIVFSDRGIWVMDDDGSNKTQLTDDQASRLPIWAPGGDKIAFVSEQNGQWGIYTISLKEKRKEKLTDVDGYPETISYSPDGRRILYLSGRKWVDGDYENQLYLYDLENGLYTYLFQKVGNYVEEPTWSPNSRYIAFTAKAVGTDTITVTDVEKKTTALLTDPEGPTAYHPSWSPDSKKIAFVSYKESWNISTINLDGSGLVQVGTFQEEPGGPKWSPDGKYIATTSAVEKNDERNNVLFLIDIVNQQQKELELGVASNDLLDWSPSGLWIATKKDDHLLLIEPVGRKRIQLPIKKYLFDFAFRWSPDGSKILYSSSFPPCAEANCQEKYKMDVGLYIVDIKTRKVIQPIKGQGVSNPSWSKIPLR